jgi:hypothetical protein
MLLVMKKNVASITSATSRVMSRSFLGFAGSSGRFAVTPDCDAEATLMILLPFGNALYQRQ